MSIFKLPDLGEGLQEVEIVEWHVKEGDEVAIDDLLVSVESAKAIVEIPSPVSGVVVKLFGNTEDVIEVGNPLVEFDTAEFGVDEFRNESETPIEAKQVLNADAGTVVGSVKSGRGEVHEDAVPITRSSSGFKVMPSVRALARKLNIDLTMVSPTGPDGLITKTDIQRVTKILANVGPQEKLRGIRRVMAQTMANSNSIIAAATIMDDADIHAWQNSTDYTMRLIRSIVSACKQEPALNAWFDS